MHILRVLLSALVAAMALFCLFPMGCSDGGDGEADADREPPCRERGQACALSASCCDGLSCIEGSCQNSSGCGEPGDPCISFDECCEGLFCSADGRCYDAGG